MQKITIYFVKIGPCMQLIITPESVLQIPSGIYDSPWCVIDSA